MGDRYYQLIGNPVDTGVGARLGTVILALDITDRESAERSRREFTANVSHELKTPLTSITGYAEIMKNGTDAAGGHAGVLPRASTTRPRG